MNVVQVLAYIQFFTNWPALTSSALKHMENAVTHKLLTDPIFEYGKSEYEVARESLSDERLLELGVTDASLFKSLGIFLLFLIVILIANSLLIILKVLEKFHVKLYHSMQVKLKEKLIYSSIFRYILQSYLKLDFTLWAFVLTSYSFATLTSSVMTSAYMLGLLGLMLWPLYIMWFTFKNQDDLEKPEIKTKYITLYTDINTDEKESLLYNVVFCARRFDIVFINVVFSANSLTSTETNHYLPKILCFLVIQSAYVIYILEAKPHTKRISFWLEMFNEGVLIILSFIMLCYCGFGDTNLTQMI